MRIANLVSKKRTTSNFIAFANKPSLKFTSSGSSIFQLATAPSPAGISARFSSLTCSAKTPAASSSSGIMVNQGNARTIKQDLNDLVKAALVAAFPDVVDEPLIAACPNTKFGDYQINNAMPLFAKLKGKEGAPKNPKATADAIIANLPANDIITETSVAGPGFINVRLSQAYLSSRINKLLVEGPQSLCPPGHKLKCVVDFSSPNVAKEMHVGHLRSTIIGDTICNMLEFQGHEVLRLNHVGDWGTQFGMLIQHMAELRPEGLGAEGGREEDVADLMALYRASKVRFDAEEDFKLRAREAVTRLQAGDDVMMAAWRRICEASRKEFQSIYNRLGVSLHERGESFYNPFLKPLLEELREKGVCVEDQGAQVVFVEGQENPLIMQKSDGGFGYASTDMAALKHRVTTEKADWIVYVTDVGQQVHFQQVFGAARKARILVPQAEGGPRVDHVGFGLVLGEDGKRLRTRSGDTVRLVELLDEAYERCKATIKERRPDIEAEELDEAARAMGYGAVKYADLKNNRQTDYRFSFDAMLDLKGNTAVYLLYAHARIASIMRKSGKDMAELAKTATIDIAEAKEKDLALHMARFPEVLQEALDDLLPNKLTDYLYDLSVKYNDFYNVCQVIGSEQEASRLLLCEAVAVLMRTCFKLLGITALYRI